MHPYLFLLLFVYGSERFIVSFNVQRTPLTSRSIIRSSLQAAPSAPHSDFTAEFQSVGFESEVKTEASVDVIISAIELYGKLNRPEEAEKVFDRASFVGVDCDISVYNALIEAWANSIQLRKNDTKSCQSLAARAEEVYQRMEFADVNPNQQTFALMLSIWRNSRVHDAVEKSMNVFQRMLKSGYIPRMESYEAVLDCLAESSGANPDNAIRASALLDDMIADGKDHGITPSIECYLSCITAWLMSERDTAAEEVTRLVRMMDATRIDYQSNAIAVALAALVVVWCRASESATSSAQRTIAALKAEDIVIDMSSRGIPIPPQTLTLLVDCWCRARNPEKAEAVLGRLSMELTESSASLVFFTTIDPSHDDTNGLVRYLGQQLSVIRLTALPWNQVIAAYGASSMSERSASDAERVYMKLLQLSASLRRSRRERPISEIAAVAAVRPDHLSYSTLVSIWASRGRLDLAEEKLSAMLRSAIPPNQAIFHLHPISPYLVTYAALLRGWLGRYTKYKKQKKTRKNVSNKDKKSTSSSSSSSAMTLNATEAKMEATKALQRVKDIFYQLCTAVTGTSTVTEEGRAGGKGRKGEKRTSIEGSKARQISTMYDNVKSFSDTLPGDQTNDIITQPMMDGDAIYCEDAFTNILSAGIRPDQSMYKAMLKVLCHEAQLPVVVLREGGMAADRAMQVFRQMRIEIKGGDTNPTNTNNNTSISSNSSSNNSSNSSGSSKSGGNKSVAPSLAPDRECYELIIRTFEGCMLSLGSASTRQELTMYPTQANAVAEHMLLAGVTPSRRIYLSLMRIWLVSRRPDSPRLVEDIFRSMVVRTSTDGPPSLESFSLVTEAWCRSPLPSAPVKAEQVLQTMEAAGVAPDTRIFSLLAYVWSKTWRWELNKPPVPPPLPSPIPPNSNATTPPAVSSSLSINTFVSRTEDTLLRCLASGMRPDWSMRRSLLKVWCREASIASIHKAEDLLVRLSVVMAVHAATSTMTMDQKQTLFFTAEQRYDNLINPSGSKSRRLDSIPLTSRIIPLDSDESLATLTPHAGFYMTLAGLWKTLAVSSGECLENAALLSSSMPSSSSSSSVASSTNIHSTDVDADVKSSSATPLPSMSASSSATIHAKAFQQRVQRETEEAFIRLGLLSTGSSSATKVFGMEENADRTRLAWDPAAPGQGLDPDFTAKFPGLLHRPNPSSEMSECLSLNRAREVGQRVSDHLLLAAYAVDGAGTGKVSVDAEELYRSMYIRRNPPSSVATNLFLEGLRRSQANPRDIITKSDEVLSELSLALSKRKQIKGEFMYNNKFSIPWGQREDENTRGSGTAFANTGSGDGNDDEVEDEEDSMPNDYTFALMMKIWRENNANDLPIRAQHLFESLLTWSPMSTQSRIGDSNNRGNDGGSHCPYFQGLPRVDVRPSERTYDALVQVWYASDPEKASRIIDRMVALGLSPAPEMYAKLMMAWADRERGDQCDEVLARLLAAGLRPDPPTCHALLRAHATGNNEAMSDSDAAERTEQALERLLQAGVRLDEEMLLTVIQAWGRQGNVRRADAMLTRGIREGVPATRLLYNIVIDIHGKSRQPDAAEQAEAMLMRMKGEERLKPDIVSYNAAIAAWGRSSHVDAEERARGLLQQAMEDGLTPNVITYSSLLSALSRSRDRHAPYRAEEIFAEMRRSGVSVDTRAWTIVISIWSRCKLPVKEAKVQGLFEEMQTSGIVPSAVTFTAMLTMWSNSRDPSASERVVEVFKSMLKSGRKLDTVGYSSLLSALSRSKDEKAALRAEEVFNQMLLAGLKADTQASTIMITIWSKSNLPDKEFKAQAIFERMLMSGDRPNAFTYTALLIMWTKSIQKNLRGQRVYIPNAPPPPPKGEMVDMKSLGEEQGLASGPGQAAGTRQGLELAQASAPGSGLGPSPITIEFAQTRIRDIYHRIWHEYVRMDGKAFGVLLVALGHAYPRTQALDVAEKLLDRLTDFDMPPDDTAWCHLMNADGSDEWWDHHRQFSTGDSRKRGFHPGGTSSEDNYPYVYRTSSSPNTGPNTVLSHGSDAPHNRPSTRPLPPTCHHRAVRLYRRMTQSSGVTLTANVFVALLAAIIRSGVPNVPELAGTAYTLIGRSVRPYDQDVYPEKHNEEDKEQTKSGRKSKQEPGQASIQESEESTSDHQAGLVTPGATESLYGPMSLQEKERKLLLYLLLEAHVRSGAAIEAETILRQTSHMHGPLDTVATALLMEIWVVYARGSHRSGKGTVIGSKQAIMQAVMRVEALLVKYEQRQMSTAHDAGSDGVVVAGSSSGSGGGGRMTTTTFKSKLTTTAGVESANQDHEQHLETSREESKEREEQLESEEDQDMAKFWATTSMMDETNKGRITEVKKNVAMTNEHRNNEKELSSSVGSKKTIRTREEGEEGMYIRYFQAQALQSSSYLYNDWEVLHGRIKKYLSLLSSYYEQQYSHYTEMKKKEKMLSGYLSGLLLDALLDILAIPYPTTIAHDQAKDTLKELLTLWGQVDRFVVKGRHTNKIGLLMGEDDDGTNVCTQLGVKVITRYKRDN